MGTSNGDTDRIWNIDNEAVRGLGSFHKTLPHNEYGEVDPAAFAAFVAATRGDGSGFAQVPLGPPRGNDLAAQLTNPRAGLASDQLTAPPADYAMPPAPRVLSHTTAAEMVELYWMALLRDADLSTFGSATPPAQLADAIKDINAAFGMALSNDAEVDRPVPGVDLPGAPAGVAPFTPQTIFRLGLPGEDIGPMVSQFFLRPAVFGTQRIDQRQRPYAAKVDYLTDFDDWLAAQNSGRDAHGQSYGKSNENAAANFEDCERYICTMRDLARFVNKDALHQAYFNAALILLSGGAQWMSGNPYFDRDNGIDKGPLADREAGFGVLGGPHILALVSEVATRALKVVWRQKWQVNLRLRPEAYGGLLHVQENGVKVNGTTVTRAYGLPAWLPGTTAATTINAGGSLLLPMAFTAGSPTHPAYGAGHATVAGACVTVLKAYFHTFSTDAAGKDHPVLFSTLKESDQPFGKKPDIVAYEATVPVGGAPPGGGFCSFDNRDPIKAPDLTIEGELNKLAHNVAMGRTMGGVHWRSDNARSLILGEALAAEMLADITTDAAEKPTFVFRTFSRGADGEPKHVKIEDGKIFVDGAFRARPVSAL